MPARVAIFSTLRSAYELPSASSSSVARMTDASIARRLVLRGARATRGRITDLTLCQTGCSLPGHGPPSRPHQPGRRRHDHRRRAAGERHTDEPAAALRAVGEAAVVGPRDL